MKSLKIISIVCAMVILFTIPVTVYGDDEETLPDPGVTPDSPFYFADRWMQQISLAFSFGEEAKVHKALRYAAERLAEMNAMARQSKAQAMQQAANEYQHCLNIAVQNMEKVLNKGIDTTGQVANAMSNHISLMNRAQYGSCEDCRQIILQTREMSQICQETAVRTLAGQDPEKALKLNLNLMEQECNRINNLAGQENGAQIEGPLQQYERLRVMNQELVANMEQLGKGPQARQMVEQAAAGQNQVLNQAANRLQAGREGTGEITPQNRLEEQQQLRIESGNGGQSTSSPSAGAITSSGNSNMTNGAGPDSDDAGSDNTSGSSGSGTASTQAGAGKGGK
jgi:hypothetical protein